MDNNRILRFSYRSIDESMIRISTFRTGFSFKMFDGKVYSEQHLRNACEVIRLSGNSRIVKDGYGQHWYHRETVIGIMEAFDTFEPIPEAVVSEEYEVNRMPDMMIYPYIRIDRTRQMIELFENHMHTRNENVDKQAFYDLNGKIISEPCF